MNTMVLKVKLSGQGHCTGKNWKAKNSPFTLTYINYVLPAPFGHFLFLTSLNTDLKWKHCACIKPKQEAFTKELSCTVTDLQK